MKTTTGYLISTVCVIASVGLCVASCDAPPQDPKQQVLEAAQAFKDAMAEAERRPLWWDGSCASVPPPKTDSDQLSGCLSGCLDWTSNCNDCCTNSECDPCAGQECGCPDGAVDDNGTTTCPGGWDCSTCDAPDNSDCTPCNTICSARHSGCVVGCIADIYGE